MLARVRARLHEVLRVEGEQVPASRWVNGTIMAIILLNVVALILESIEPLALAYGRAFHLFEVASVAVFTVEYAARLWSAPEDPRYRNRWTGRMRWAVTPLAVVDLLAILPFYLPMLVALDLRVLRILRILRILRVIKLARYSKALQSMGRVFRRKRYELGITLITVGFLLILAASLMYAVEHEAQPGAFSSIPETLWWAVVTLTTVGYGDVVPITTVGRVLGAVIAILGIGMLALPAGILGSGFVEEIQRKRDQRLPPRCPHCGEELHLEPEDEDT